MEGNPTKALKSSILQYPLLFRSPFQGRLDLLDFWLPRPPKWVEHHKSTRNVDFAIPALFPKEIFKAPCISWISGFQSRRTGGNTTKAPKLSAIPAPFPEAISKAPWISGFPASIAAEMGGTLKSTKIVDFAIPAPFPEAISKVPCISWISGFQGRRNGENPTKDFAIPAPFPAAISKATWISWISGFRSE